MEGEEEAVAVVFAEVAAAFQAQQAVAFPVEEIFRVLPVGRISPVPPAALFHRLRPCRPGAKRTSAEGEFLPRQ